ncbi:MAG: 5'/3'-nucleotidase SurE [Candidatus Thorarchaeota archaeon]
MSVHILLTNDDGINSPGLLELKKILEQQKDYELTIIAPTNPQSAQSVSHSHGNTWVNWEKVNDSPPMYSVNGSPATCISVALRELNITPDLTVSGINYGENIGLNLFYSGTIGAAWESAMSGFLSLASSLELPPNLHFTLNKEINFTEAAYLTLRVIEKLLNENPISKLWNLNVPMKASRTEKILEAKIGTERWNYPVIRERINEGSKGIVRFEFDPTGKIFEENTDITLLRQGKVVLTAINELKFPWSMK